MLFIHSIAHAESTEPATAENRMQTQIEKLQNQVQETNSKIAAMQTALKIANQDIEILQNSAALKLNTKTIVHRTANGHGR
jgi:peptidoglycan hydrolase CwlO-like protein